MLIHSFRSARAALITGAVVGALVLGEVPGPAQAASRPAVHCSGDDAMRPVASQTVAYDALQGQTFKSRAAKAEGRVISLGRGRLRLRNFKRADGSLNGGVLGGTTGGLVGAGASRSTVALVAHSSTHKSDVPHTSSRTNQMSILRATGSARLLRGFLVRATVQGHIYNGLRVDRVQGLRASHIKVVGVPGNEHQQPGETFGINDFRTVGSRWSHIVVDGHGVGASGFGVNTSKNITICAATARNNAAAMGFAFWQSNGIRLVDCVATDNGFSGFNFERTSGTVTMIRPVAHGNRYDMRIASDRSSAKFRIVDPKLVHGRWTIWMPKRWFTVNKQKRADVTLIIHGRTRNDLLRFVTY